MLLRGSTHALLFAVGIAALIVALLPAGLRADGDWLDASLPPQWNTAGMALPLAPKDALQDLAFADPRCLQNARAPQSPAEEQVSAAGWLLYAPPETGSGITVAGGTSGYDGMCRPAGYQLFVFADGVFAGTVSPSLMVSRTDGSATTPTITGPDALSIRFNRYADADALCCPSRITIATYRVDRDDGLPVLTLTETVTRSTAEQNALESALP